jgi:nitrogen fixation NifU-like protein
MENDPDNARNPGLRQTIFFLNGKPRSSNFISTRGPILYDACSARIDVSALARNTDPMYSEAVLDHFQNPRNAGTLDAATAVISVENPVCGDILELSARMDAGRIAEARFRTRGCVTAVACSSLLTELLRGKTPSEARAITPEQLSEALGGLSQATFHAAQLARDAAAALVARLG